MTQGKILIARHVHRHCGESAFGSAEGGLTINTVFNYKPWDVLGTVYM